MEQLLNDAIDLLIGWLVDEDDLNSAIHTERFLRNRCNCENELPPCKICLLLADKKEFGVVAKDKTRERTDYELRRIIMKWEDITQEFRYNNSASVVKLNIKRPIPMNSKQTACHYLIHSEHKYPAALLMHEDEFGDMFGSNLTKRINELLKTKRSITIMFAVEVS